MSRSRSRNVAVGHALLVGGVLSILSTRSTQAQAQDPESPRRIADSSGSMPSETTPTPVRSDFDPYRIQRIELTAVDQSISDRGPLDAGLRWIPSGLRLPTGYDQVYTREDGGFWRADGGLVATFQQSVYVSTRSGLAADIPASTVFVIGGVPMGSEPGHGRLLAVDPLDPTSIPPVGPVTMVPDELHEITAAPGDHPARFGFGPGYRMTWTTDEVPGGPPVDRTRFQEDATYRAGRLAAMLSHWRNADLSPLRGIPNPSPLEAPTDPGGESDPIPPEAASPDPGS